MGPSTSGQHKCRDCWKAPGLPVVKATTGVWWPCPLPPSTLFCSKSKPRENRSGKGPCFAETCWASAPRMAPHNPTVNPLHNRPLTTMMRGYDEDFSGTLAPTRPQRRAVPLAPPPYGHTQQLERGSPRRPCRPGSTATLPLLRHLPCAAARCGAAAPVPAPRCCRPLRRCGPNAAPACCCCCCPRRVWRDVQ
jgi:hypothetical protein